MQIIVLGMHRCGTSATTRLINMMGAYFGPESSIGEITDDNPKGFWERPEVFKLNESILASKGCSWSDLTRWDGRATAHTPDNILKIINKLVLGMDAFRPWVLKDPRLCLLLPIWQRFLEVPIAVIVHRDPFEIAQSLHKRDGFTISKGVNLWEQYASGIVQNTQAMPKILVQHSDLLARPVETCHSIFQQLAALGVRRIALPTEREITAFIDPKLYRSKPAEKLPLSSNQQALLDILEGRRPFPQNQ